MLLHRCINFYQIWFPYTCAWSSSKIFCQCLGMWCSFFHLGLFVIRATGECPACRCYAKADNLWNHSILLDQQQEEPQAHPYVRQPVPGGLAGWPGACAGAGGAPCGLQQWAHQHLSQGVACHPTMIPALTSWPQMPARRPLSRAARWMEPLLWRWPMPGSYTPMQPGARLRDWPSSLWQ